MSTVPLVFSLTMRRSLALLLFLVAFCPALAVTTATYHHSDLPNMTTATILYIGNLNFDCYADTLKGHPLEETPYTQFLPDSILWGQPDTAAPPCPSYISPGARSVTRFVYPSWMNFSASFAIQTMNTNDSVPDLIFYFWGKAGVPITDTSRIFVLYAQEGLNQLATITTGTITYGFQSAPFFAMDLEIGEQLIEPAFRDPSGTESYVILSQSVSVHGDSISPPPPLIHNSLPPVVHIYPNPAAQSASVQASAIAPGEYTVTLQAVNGKVYHTQSVSVDGSKELNRLLDLGQVPTGYYVVHLKSKGRFYGAYPVIVVH